MSKQTTKYKLGYFQEGDFTSGVTEMQRWETIDAQLKAVFSIVGNGILSGWNLVDGGGLKVNITPGAGHVAFVSVESTTDEAIASLTPSTRNYIYAELVADSYWNKTVAFGAYNYQDDLTDNLYIGYVDTDATKVTAINTDGRAVLGFRALIESIVADHEHIGGTGNPDPIDLSSEVQGVLNQDNLPNNLDASIIQTGTLDTDRFPKLDHITKLTNQGTLTHAQLEAFVESMSAGSTEFMGETSTINLLQLTLALMHVYPEIDEYMVNQIAYIPGISPDDYVDWTNTTATVDILPASSGGTHTITGTAASGLTAYTKIWDDETDYSGATQQDVIIDGDSVTLATTRNSLILDEFSDISQWVVETQDLSSIVAGITADSTDFISGTSAKISIGSQEAEMALVVKKEFTAQDWSDYKYIRFYLKTENVDHGDLIFYLQDGSYGIQNSYIKVLDRNTATINVDTLQAGWQEVTVDISSYQRESINMIAFYTSTQDGWNTSKAFEFNLEGISLDSGNIFEENGYVRVIFGNGSLPYDFYRARWDALVPSDSGIVIKLRYRTANTLADLSAAIWSSYITTSGTAFSIPSETLYKYIELEVYFNASTDKTAAPTLTKLYLDFYVNDTDTSFEYTTQDDWESGTLFSIDTSSSVGSIKVSETEDIGKYTYGTDGRIVRLNDAMLEEFYAKGTALPKSTYQAKNNLAPGFGLITGVDRGNNGNLWLTDVDNDRVIEVDKYGNLVRGFYGSFLSAPYDPYGNEENGPGSNTNVSAPSTSSTSSATQINVLHSIYNPSTGILYIIFDQNIENIYVSTTTLDTDKIYVKIGTSRFNLQDSTFELLGVDETQYNRWYAISTSENASTYAPYIGQFTFNSHVLKITMVGAEKTYLSYLVDQEQPSLYIRYPKEQQIFTSTNITVRFGINNCTLGTDSGEYSIRTRIDGGAWQTVYVDNITFYSLTKTIHTVEAQLVDSDGVAQTNIEAVATGHFIIVNSTFSSPAITIDNPLPNQIFSSSPATIAFTVQNFAIVPSGQHIRYILDSEPAVDHYSLSDITLDDIEPGSHTLQLYLVDENGTNLGYTYGTCIATFIVGLNSEAIPKLYVDSGAIYDATQTKAAATSRTYIDVGSINMENIYSPVDVQVIPEETSGLGDGSSTVVVAKMRSPSWTTGLGNADRATELSNRITQALATESGTTSDVTLNTSLASIATGELIYGTKYLDGHSVVQLNLSGETIFSNNAAKFATTKDNLKDTLGSAYKIGESEFLIADASDQRAIVTYSNLSTESSMIQWQYDSDRYVTDFQIVPRDAVTINIYDDSVSPQTTFIRQGTTVTWVNNSSSPVSVYSGTTTYDTFQEDPDLTNYGSVFYSPTLASGESYSFRFTSYGDFNWFVYPGIITAQVSVTQYRISSMDQYYVLESDGRESPFSSRLIKIDSWGNVLWAFGESFIVKPRDVRPMLNNKVLIST